MPTRAKSSIRPPIKKIINELKSWLPNYSREQEYPTLLLRILASLQGGDQLEDAGYEPISGIGWHEADQLGRTLEAIKDKRDVEDIARELLSDNEEELEEAPVRGSAPPPFQPSAKRGTAREPGRVEAKRRGATGADWEKANGSAFKAGEMEQQILSIGRELLPACAVKVLDGGQPTPEYWAFLLSQLPDRDGHFAPGRARSTHSPVRRSLHGRKSQPPRRRR